MTTAGWTKTTLGEVTEIVSGGTPKTSVFEYWDGGIPWATPKDLSTLSHASITGTPRTLSQQGLKSCGATVLPPGSVLLSSRAPIGHVAINKVPMATNQGFKSFVLDDKQVDSKFLFWWLKRHRPLLESLGNGATFKEISKRVTAAVPIELPPVEEQRRIAAVLDAADALRAKRRQAIAKLDSLTQAIFIGMFGDPLTNPMGWAADRVLSDVADARSGITKGRKTGDTQLTAVPYLAVVNVQDGFIEMKPLKSIDATESEIERYRLLDGDILLTEGGDPDKLGRGAVWTAPFDPCIHQNHVFRVRVTDEEMTPEFLSRLLGSTRGKRYFLRMAKQTTGIASINMTQLRNFPILEPPLSLQQEFLARTRDVDEQLALASCSEAKIDTLFGSLQQRAFRGEL